MKLEILDHLTDPGSPDKRNDDSLCIAEGLAAVFDGATGLGDEPVVPEFGSDAAWIAELAARHFENAGRAPAGEVVRRIATDARGQLSRHADLGVLPRYAWPTSGFEMVRLDGGAFELSGLGDCCAYVLEPGGDFVVHTAIVASREAEMAAARAMLDRCGGFGDGDGIIRAGETLEALRRGRERHNTPDGGVWTIGLAEEAGDHVSTIRLEARPGTLVLLMTDGFSALAEMYQRHSPAALVEAAARDGLGNLLAEIRSVERSLDPMAIQYPRFKRSDDATAILARIA